MERRSQFRLCSNKGFPACANQRKVGHQSDFPSQGVVGRSTGSVGEQTPLLGGGGHGVSAHRGEAITVVQATKEGTVTKTEQQPNVPLASMVEATEPAVYQARVEDQCRLFVQRSGCEPKA